VYLVGLSLDVLRAEPQVVLGVDLREARDPFVEGRHCYQLPSPSDIDALGAWFRADLGQDHWISNAPPNGMPSWSQGIFPFRERLSIPQGGKLDLSLATYDGRIWRWQVGVESARSLDHSTFAGFPIELSTLRAEGAFAKPSISPRGRAALRALSTSNGQSTNQQLADKLMADHPGLFPTASAARVFLGKLARLCSLPEG
jgi:hypothetical protein